MRGFTLHALLAERAEWMGEGSVGDGLIDLGRYPGAVPDDRGVLRGEMHRLARSEHWGALDSPEGPRYHRQARSRC